VRTSIIFLVEMLSRCFHLHCPACSMQCHVRGFSDIAIPGSRASITTCDTLTWNRTLTRCLQGVLLQHLQDGRTTYNANTSTEKAASSKEKRYHLGIRVVSSRDEVHRSQGPSADKKSLLPSCSWLVCTLSLGNAAGTQHIQRLHVDILLDSKKR